MTHGHGSAVSPLVGGKWHNTVLILVFATKCAKSFTSAFAKATADRVQARTTAKPLFGRGESIYALALSGDQTRLAYISDEGIWLGDMRAQNSSELIHAECLPDDIEWQSLGRLCWSPDGCYLCFTIYGPDPWGRLYVIDTVSKRVIPLGQDTNFFYVFIDWRPQPGHR